MREDWCPKNTQKIILKHSDDDLDLIAVACRQFLILSVYVNVNRNDSNVLNVLNSVVDEYCDVYYIFMLGDFNRISFRPHFLGPLMTNIVDFPTRDGVKLDQIWTNERRDVVTKELSKLSDHSGILCEPVYPCKFNQPKRTKITKVKITDKDKLQCELESTEWESLLKTCTNLDEKNDLITSYIKFCVESCSSWEKIETINDSIISNSFIKFARRKREKCFKINDKSGFDLWHKKIEGETKRITSAYLSKLKKNNNSKDYWSNIKLLAGVSTKDITNFPSVNVDALNKHFLRYERSPDIDSVIIHNDDIEPTLLSHNDVLKLLYKNKNKLSCGIDGIPPWVLKQFAFDLTYPVKEIFNECLKSRTIPSLWKKILITPIIKPNSDSLPIECRFRPIGNNCSLSKTFEYLLLEQLNKYVPDCDQNQFAYKKNVSTCDAISKLLQNICINLDNSSQCVVRNLFLDYSSAFNCISRGKVLETINENSPSWLTYLMKDMFCNITQSVKLGKKMSAFMPCNTGVIQGGVCSPMCFNIITRSLTVDDENGLLIKFSDDQALSVVLKNESDWNKYVTVVQKLCLWSENNFLCLNPEKTQELVILNKNVQNPVILDLASRKICIKNIAISMAGKIKYLGVIIDKDLTFHWQIEKSYKKSLALSYYGLKLFRRTSFIAAVHSFVDMCIIPIISYSLHCFIGFITVDSFSLLRRILRRLAVISNINKEEFCNKFCVTIFKCLENFAAKYPPDVKTTKYNTRSVHVIPLYNKSKTQKLTTYQWYFRKKELTEKICNALVG